MAPRTPHAHRRQRGAVALGVSLLLLLAASIALFHLHRAVVLEQRASANQLRSTSAFELAEAGVEWATGMLNSPLNIGPDCRPLPASGESFRHRYLQDGPGAGSGLQIAIDRFPGCRIDAGALACECPGGAVAPAGATTDATLPGFSVAFSPVVHPSTGTTDPGAVRVTATGCNARAPGPVNPCRPADAPTAGEDSAREGVATVSVILKLAPSLRTRPSAALTCARDCVLDGPTRIASDDATVAGLLVHAGGRIISRAEALLQGLPGQPAAAALAPADAFLAGLAAADPDCSASAVFSAFFGMSLAQYAEPGGEVLSLPGCNDPASCGPRLAAAFDAGWRSFHFPDGLWLDGRGPLGTLGSPADGVRLVSPGRMRLEGALTIHGLVVTGHPDPGGLATGSAEIHGAVIACGSHRQEAGAIVYEASALEGSLPRGPLVRVPGSWRDF